MILREYQVWELCNVGAKAAELCMEHRYGITSSRRIHFIFTSPDDQTGVRPGPPKGCGPQSYIYHVLSMYPQTF